MTTIRYLGMGGAALGVFLGGVVVGSVQAQMKPANITVTEINVKDEAAYKEWLPEVQKLIKASGGEYLAGGFNKTTTFEGDPPPNRVVIIKYPSIDAAKGFWQDSKSLVAKAEKFATFRAYGVEAIEAK
jgi:uncharacterized protein (DUF1330 family)